MRSRRLKISGQVETDDALAAPLGTVDENELGVGQEQHETRRLGAGENLAGEEFFVGRGQKFLGHVLVELGGVGREDQRILVLASEIQGLDNPEFRGAAGAGDFGQDADCAIRGQISLHGVELVPQRGQQFGLELLAEILMVFSVGLSQGVAKGEITPGQGQELFERRLGAIGFFLLTPLAEEILEIGFQDDGQVVEREEVVFVADPGEVDGHEFLVRIYSLA